MSTVTAYVIEPDGTSRVEHWDAEGGTYTGLQTAIGGLFDVVSLAADLDMWVHDEGKIIGLELNPIATVLGQAICEGWRHDFVAGPAVFTGGADSEGRTLTLTPAQVEWFTEAIAFAAARLGIVGV